MQSMQHRMVSVGSDCDLLPAVGVAPAWPCVSPCRAWLRPSWGRVSVSAKGCADASCCCQLSRLPSELLAATY